MPRHKKSTLIEAMRPIVDGLRAADILIMIVCGAGAYTLRYPAVALSEMYFVTLVCGVLMFGVIANACHLYRVHRLQRLRRQMVPLVMAHGLTLLGLLALLFFAHFAGRFSRIWVGLWFCGAFGCMVLLRLLVLRWMEQKLKSGAFARRTVLLGGVEKTMQLIAGLRQDQESIQIVAVCITDGVWSGEFFDTGFSQIPVIPSVALLVEYCRRAPVDEVVITSDLEYHADAATILSSMETLPCSVKYCIPWQFLGRPLSDAGVLSHSAQIALPVMTVFRTPLTGRERLRKRASDCVFGSIALILAAPVMAVAAFLIKWEDGGNIFFCQPRHGFAGNEFSILKFRSMRVEEMLEVTQATCDDARVTRIGKWMRRLSIDELPQLINVLKGEMSLVGPRPHAVRHNDYYEKIITSYALRHRIKPGITGWAQVNGFRGETDTTEKMQKRVEYDLYYIEHWSLWLDIKILILTVVALLRPKNAY